MDQSPISAARFADALPTSPLAAAAWGTFAAYVVEPPPHFAGQFSDHLLSLQLSGTCRFRQQVGARSVEGWSSPGCVHLLPANLTAQFDGRDHTGASRAIALFIPEEFLSRVLVQDWEVEPRSVEFLPQFLGRDRVVEALLTRLGIEARNDDPSGRLYAESACEFLAHHVIQAYSSLSTHLLPVRGGLTARGKKIVLEYIAANLAQPITLRRLAELACISPRHFERAFRQAVGVPPHAYVMSKRIAAAQQFLLSQPSLSVEEIAARVGFSSSSHLASAFRRHTGYSPTTFRRLQSR
jgi:AraC family transcriptional regulator